MSTVKFQLAFLVLHIVDDISIQIHQMYPTAFPMVGFYPLNLQGKTYIFSVLFLDKSKLLKT